MASVRGDLPCQKRSVTIEEGVTSASGERASSSTSRTHRCLRVKPPQAITVTDKELCAAFAMKYKKVWKTRVSE